jgi:hypothetical protein
MTDSRRPHAILLGVTEPWGLELVKMKGAAANIVFDKLHASRCDRLHLYSTSIAAGS